MRRLISVAFSVSISVAFLFVLAACGGNSNPPTTPIFTSPGTTALATDQVVFDSTRASSNREIFVMKADGSNIQRLTTNSAYEHWWPRISPDRKKILFYRRPARVAADDYGQASLWVMNADGGGVTQLIGEGEFWTMQGHAEWSPHGDKIAMFGSYQRNNLPTLQIFVASLVNGALSGPPLRYTNQPGINTDVSWSPDGSKLLFNGCAATPCTPANYEIFVMDASGPGTPTQLTNDGLADYDPYFSPDGSTIAWLTTTNPDPSLNQGAGTWGIRIASIGGTNVFNTTLSNTHTLIDDGQVNSKPAWSADGGTIFFHRINFAEDGLFGVFKIKADGTALTRLTTINTGINEFPSN